MSRIEPRVLKGFRDYLPEVMIPREAMLEAVARVFRSFGFHPLATPALEYSDILVGKYGDEGDQLLYRFEDNGKRDVSLRYDLTVPLARVMGQHGAQLPRPFRRYQIAPVWRAEKPAHGRFREFMQCDVDVVGEPSLVADFECMQVGVAVLRALGVTRFEMRVNDRRVLDGLMRRLGVADSRQQVEMLRVVDKLPKIGWDAMLAELRTKVELDEAGTQALHTFLHGSLDAVDDRVVDLDVAGPGLESLRTLLGWAAELGIAEHLSVDLSIARGLDYYTSTIYETFLTDLPSLGSVMSGGRYDRLLALFTGEELPAVGISLGVDRLLAGLGELGLLPASAGAPQVFIAVAGAAQVPYALRLAAQLRQAGLVVLQGLGADQKLGKQLKLAARVGARITLVVGDEERLNGTVGLKDMTAGSQVSVSAAEIVAQVRALIPG